MLCRGLIARGFQLELVFPPDPATVDLLISGAVGPLAYPLGFDRALKVFWTFESLWNDHDDADARREPCGCETFSFADYRGHERYFDYSFSFDPTSATNFQVTAATFDDLLPRLSRPLSDAEVRSCLDAKTGFACFLYSQGCEGNEGIRIRNDFFRRLSALHSISSGGAVMNNIGGPLPRDQTSAFVAQHKFTIAMENSSSPGYVSEKILHGFLSGTVPIYWGAPEIESLFDPRAFVHYRGDGDFDRVAAEIERLDRDEAAYADAIARPKLGQSADPAFLPGALDARIDEIAERLRQLIGHDR